MLGRILLGYETAGAWAACCRAKIGQNVLCGDRQVVVGQNVIELWSGLFWTEYCGPLVKLCLERMFLEDGQQQYSDCIV